MSNDARLGIVIPTYNERDTVGALVSSLFALPFSRMHVVFVDDHSPDGTGDMVRAFQQQHPTLHLIERSGQRGLGPAYIAGFRYILTLPVTHIIQMDADFSHAVADIPRIVAALDDAEVVLGSRYVAGGRIHHWDAARRLVSRYGNWYARHMLSLPFADLTGGFKGFRREALSSLRWEDLSSIGYCFQIEVTNQLFRMGKKVQEIPIIFTERRIGRSKFHAGILWESMIRVAQLRHALRRERQ